MDAIEFMYKLKYVYKQQQKYIISFMISKDGRSEIIVYPWNGYEWNMCWRDEWKSRITFLEKDSELTKLVLIVSFI